MQESHSLHVTGNLLTPHFSLQESMKYMSHLTLAVHGFTKAAIRGL